MKAILTLLILLTTSLVFAQQYYQVTTDVLNVRSSANKNAEVISKLNLGDSVYVVDHSTAWSQVKLNDESYGYVSSKFISKDFKPYSKATTQKKKEKTSVWGTLAVLAFIFLAWLFKSSSKNSSSGSSNRSLPKSKLSHWYVCKNCNEKIQSGKKPTSLNCSHATFHYWTDLGEVGDKNFNCKNCGITVWTSKKPTSLNCSIETFHHWTEL